MENKEILVCYYCGILYDDQYEECSCGCAAKPISTKELAALNLTNTSRLRNIEKTSPPSPAIDIPLSAKTKEEIIKRGPWYNLIAQFQRELSAANAKIAELEQTIREQKEWINSHL